MQSEGLDYDCVFKLLLIGDSGVGKSSILLRFAEDDFEEDRPVTIGVDFKNKIVNMDGKRINLTIWDTAGQEKFRSLTGSYYRGTHGIILVYDVTRRQSFDAIDHWLGEVDIYSTNRDVIKLLVGNKLDKATKQVSTEEAMRYAKSKNMLFMECSAKTNLGVQQAFEEFVHKIAATPSLWEKKKESTKIITPTQEDSSESQGMCGGYYSSYC